MVPPLVLGNLMKLETFSITFDYHFTQAGTQIQAILDILFFSKKLLKNHAVFVHLALPLLSEHLHFKVKKERGMDLTPARQTGRPQPEAADVYARADACMWGRACENSYGFTDGAGYGPGGVTAYLPGELFEAKVSPGFLTGEFLRGPPPAHGIPALKSAVPLLF